MENHKMGWLYVLMQVFISFGILGIVNADAVFMYKSIKVATSEKYPHASQKSINMKAIINSLAICIGFFIVFSTLGIFFIDTSNYGNDYGSTTHMAQLYSMVDITAN
jgi:cytochrome c biogenesis protein CcdA